MADDSSFRDNLLRIRGVDEKIAEMIVGSGVTMRQLSGGLPSVAAFAFGLDGKIAIQVGQAASRFAAAAKEVMPSNQGLDGLRMAPIDKKALLAVGLSPEAAETLVQLEANWSRLAAESPKELFGCVKLTTGDCIKAIALARLRSYHEGRADDLVGFWQEQQPKE